MKLTFSEYETLIRALNAYQAFWYAESKKPDSKYREASASSLAKKVSELTAKLENAEIVNVEAA